MFDVTFILVFNLDTFFFSSCRSLNSQRVDAQTRSRRLDFGAINESLQSVPHALRRRQVQEAVGVEGTVGSRHRRSLDDVSGRVQRQAIPLSTGNSGGKSMEKLNGWSEVFIHSVTGMYLVECILSNCPS